MDHESVRGLWEVVASFGRGMRVERRSETRLPAHGVVIIRQNVEEIRWAKRSKGMTVSEPVIAEIATLLDISTHGFSFRVARPLALEQKFLAGPEGDECFEAVVRHVEPDGEEYIIGAEFLSRDEQSEQRGRGGQAVAEVAADHDPKVPALGVHTIH